VGVAFDKSSGAGWMDGLTNTLDALALPAAPVANDPPVAHAMHRGAAAAPDAIEREQVTPASLLDKQIKLSPKRLDGYFAMLQRMLASAQLGVEYPDVDRVMSHLEGMRSLHQIGTRGLGFALSRESGLPVYASWMLLEKSRDQAASNLVDAAATRRLQNAIRGKQSTVATTETLNALRRDEAQLKVDRRNLNAAWVEPLEVLEHTQTFRVVSDRLVAPGLLQRTSVIIEQALEPNRWERIAIARDDAGAWSMNPDLHKTLVSGGHQSVDELAIVLGRVWGASCVEISRGTIGPIWFEGVQNAPAPVAKLIADNPAAVVGNFTLQHATCEREAPKPQEQGGTLAERLMRFIDKDARLERWVQKATDTVRAMTTWSSTREQTWVCSPEIAAQLESAVATDHITVRKIY
jgi:hypothetical protein